MLKIYVLFAWIVFLSTIVLGQQNPLEGTMAVAKIISVKGEDGKIRTFRHKNIDDVKPNEILEYTITYTNISQQILQDIQIVGPIPSTTYFIKNSLQTQKTAEFWVSIDGGVQFAKPPLKRKIEKNGKTFLIEISEKEWTHVRCTIPQLLPNESTIIRYWVMVK